MKKKLLISFFIIYKKSQAEVIFKSYLSSPFWSLKVQVAYKKYTWKTEYAKLKE